MVVCNIFYFHPHLGKWSNLTNIFQMGWNHQPDSHYNKLLLAPVIWGCIPRFKEETWMTKAASMKSRNLLRNKEFKGTSDFMEQMDAKWVQIVDLVFHYIYTCRTFAENFRLLFCRRTRSNNWQNREKWSTLYTSPRLFEMPSLPPAIIIVLICFD